MWLTELKTFNFRNLEDATLRFSSGANLICGRNGQGKTNLLEAIYLMAQGRSFRGGKLKEIVRWEHEASSVFGAVRGSIDDTELGVVFENGLAQVFINQRKAGGIARLLGNLLVVSFTPRDLELVRGGPAERRAMVDKHVVDLTPAMLGEYQRYQRALKTKQKLLSSEDVNSIEIATLHQIMAEAGSKIIAARARVLEVLEKAATRHYENLRYNEGALELVYEPCLDVHLATNDGLYRLFESKFPAERLRRASLCGPHREEVSICLGGHPAQQFASQGQCRSIVLALKLALIDIVRQERNEAPLVLLDDVESELDEFRCKALARHLREHSLQVFLTGTAPSELVWGGGEVARFSVESGKVSGNDH